MNDALKRAPEALAPIAAIFAHSIAEYGTQPHGVFWRSRDGQHLRFDILLGIMELSDLEKPGATFNDFGCGYGALFKHIQNMPFMQGGRYVGYDICEEMVIAARRHASDPRASFIQSMVATREADYSIVSGTFNMRIDIDDAAWLEIVKASLSQIWSKTRKGLAFNMLSNYDKSNRQVDLYYADPCVFFDFCMRQLGRNVTLLHDYPLKEWTIFVRR